VSPSHPEIPPQFATLYKKGNLNITSMPCKKRRSNRKIRQTVLKFESLKRRRAGGSNKGGKVSSLGEVSQSIATSVIRLKPKEKGKPLKILSLVEYNDTTAKSRVAQHLDDAVAKVKQRMAYKKNTYDPPEAVLRPGLQFGTPVIINRSQQSWLRDESEDTSESESWIEDSIASGQWLTRRCCMQFFIIGGVGVILIIALAFTFFFLDATGSDIQAIVTSPLNERRAPARPSTALPLVFDLSSLPYVEEITESLNTDALIKIIQEMTHEDLLGDIDTPQGKAFRWIQSNNLDGMNIARIEQRYILAVFYFHFEVEAWNIEYGWLSNKHECTWHGVRCGIDASDAIGRKLSSTNEKLTEIVTGLDLTENNLHGKLPEDLKYMTNLVQLILSKNFIQGQIPAGLFSNFQSMNTLYLDENYLNGQVPDELGHLLLLRNLDLHDNSLRGTIPNAFNILTDLVDVRLQNNEFYGEIPDVFGGTTNLRVFLAGNNEIEGTIPASLADCPQLVALHLHNNELRGSIPEFISAELRQLHLDNNSLEGPIPLFVASSPSVLEELRLENNKLSGEVSSTLGDQTSLTMLQLQGNVLTGSVPDSVCLLKTQPKLKHLAVACAGSGEEIRCDCCDSC